jgi:hypothetical protein
VRVQVESCPFPITQPTDEGAVQLAWDDGEQYLEVEVLPGTGIQWYFRNRRTEEVLGTETPISSPPHEFFEKLRLQNLATLNGRSARTAS